MINRFFLHWALLLIFISGYQYACAQARKTVIKDSLLRQMDSSQQVHRVLGANPRFSKIGDSLWVVSGICKPLLLRKFDDLKMTPTHSFEPAAEKRSGWLKVHGNVEYDFIHRSYVDTPFAQREFQQHTVQASLRITVKDKYPLKMNIATRASNSPYFRNFFDLGLQLDQYNYVKDYRQQLLAKASQKIYQSPDLRAMEASLKEKAERVQQLRARLSEPDIFQRIVEEREKRYLQKVKSEKGILPDSMAGPDLQQLREQLTHKAGAAKEKSYTLDDEASYTAFIGEKKKQLDSLQQDLVRFQRKTDSLRRSVDKEVAEVRKRIYQAKNKHELKRIARESEWAADKENGFDKFLSNVRTVGIGRSMVSYSELTVWNVSVTGLNLEYNDGKIYAAVTGGRMDYGFRDFFGSNSKARQQSLLMGRFGIGDKDDKALIFSVFTGKKYNYGIVQADSVSSHVDVTGYSLEAVWKKDAYTSFSAELAKTTRPVAGSAPDRDRLASLFDLGDGRNLGATFKGQSRLNKTGTKLEGFVRKTGEHFQSFSLFTYNTDQLAWQLRMDQPLWKDRLTVTGMLRRNDFSHPFADKTFKTSTVFTSLQATLRMPRWPVLSAGYFPGTQLYIEDGKRVLENVYYMLNASAVYQYEAGAGRMISSAIYNRYSGRGTDSGFVAYSGVNYMFSQTYLLGALQVQLLYNFTDQERMRYHTVEGGMDYAITKAIRVGGAGKYNRILNGDGYWGSRAQATIGFRQLGSLQLQYDKSFLPTVYGSLFAVESGRVTWLKIF